VITAENRKLLADSLLKSCDALDGAADGVIGDPRECKFDPATLPRCSETQSTGCVTRRQLAAIRAVYADALIGEERIYPGPPFGGENDAGGWDVWMTSPAAGPLQPGTPNLHFAFGLQFARNFVFDDPDWTYVGYDFADWRERTAELSKLLDATDPDLRKFRDRGGKLILWHGWSDSALPATRTVEYYEAARKVESGLNSYARLFMMPGVGHCRNRCR
jgi:feruloyl esterase